MISCNGRILKDFRLQMISKLSPLLLKQMAAVKHNENGRNLKNKTLQGIILTVVLRF